MCNIKNLKISIGDDDIHSIYQIYTYIINLVRFNNVNMYRHIKKNIQLISAKDITIQKYNNHMAEIHQFSSK